jgi:hypothetical protein
MDIPENLRLEGGSEIDSTISAGRKTPREKKIFGRQKSAGAIPSQRGEIVADTSILHHYFVS